mmetsp:Transcript_42655/g.62460  ORF Transcript_42655/g.62460 Transcript_42655/m.62460 type:complete len:172 (+) Transcript_42655:76-591(+)|eukprot:CAMPEP_0195510950 /NCGR_PEP_ID=MMETSP0794_2-20130614/3439_1 /TAXON_ID=515487 /ORGANISM="Stephanopyxis turris, Strain CCMP 815" /LENGTH=171 /DNA_ID=CAMNT_0040638473 /DNA_START=57 /DNA_END=572 /DNA_ORIENTATION=+
MKSSTSSVLLLLVITETVHSAWVTLPSTGVRFQLLPANVIQKRKYLNLMSEDHHEAEGFSDIDPEVQAYRANLENSYNRLDYFDECGVDEDEQSADLRSRPGVTDENYAWNEVCGEECELQCEIPEDFKLSGDQSVDVMAFLGISRAEPLIVKPEMDRLHVRDKMEWREWE